MMTAADYHERYRPLVEAAQRIGCTCGHDHNDRRFNCNCCMIRYALEDLGLYTGGPYVSPPPKGEGPANG